jgi:lysophospholipase L1-like esterase
MLLSTFFCLAWCCLSCNTNSYDLPNPGRFATKTSSYNIQDTNPFAEQTVLHIGDSQVAGPYGYHLGRLINNHEAELYIRQGQIGKGIRWWLTNRRLERLIQRVQPDIILITLGGNDIWHAKNNPIEYENLIHQFIEIIQPYDFVWITPPVAIGRSQHLQPLRSTVTEMLIKNLEVLDSNHFIDTRTLSTTYDEDNRTYDGIHYTFLGGNRWANEVIGQIERKLLNQND